MIGLAAAAIALPFLGAVTGLLFGRRLTRPLLGRRRGPWTGPAVVAVAPVAASTLLTLVVALAVWTDPGVRTGTLSIVPTGTVPFGLGLYVDGLSAAVALMVCCVALAVQVYSVSYMAADRRYGSYAAFVSLFTAAMLLVVLGGDLIVLYAGWEVMGLCSYLLIGHRWEADGRNESRGRAASRAAVKAFLVTRVGDVAFLFGIFVLGIGAGTFSVSGVVAYHYPHATVLAGTLLLIVGVVAKSAQFPLHTWLPDAMVGPTPVSALIHAATMVAAGVYVVARLFPAFLQAPAALAVLGVVAAISMLGSALAALVQDELKQVLAYSTISQVAYMAAGLAVGARDAAILQLLAHGAFKALLFLGAGCVIMVVGSGMLSDMGGLRLAMPVTFWSMSIGWAALAGIPVASGFFSKDAIIAAAQHAAFGRGDGASGVVRADGVPPGGIPGWTAVVVYVALLLTVAVTGAYAARAWFMTFFGERRIRAGADPPLMHWPVAALAVPALVLGFFGLGSAALRPAPVATVVTLVMAAAGAGAAFVLWNRDPALDPVRVLGRPVRTVFARAINVDGAYDRAIVRPVRMLAGLVLTMDGRILDPAVAGVGRAVRRLGELSRRTEGGNPQAYVTGLLAGVAIIALAVVVLT